MYVCMYVCMYVSNLCTYTKHFPCLLAPFPPHLPTYLPTYLQFVDQELIDQTETPDWDALTAEVPEAIPWHEQDHSVGR